MASVPDLINLLCLDPKKSLSPFGGRHRTLLISRDYGNSGDFVFNNLLHNFVRKEPTTPVLLITLSHDWTSYSACAAKCGYNLRKSQNGGQIDVLNIMDCYLKSIRDNNSELNYCDYIIDYVFKFIAKHDDSKNINAHHDLHQPTMIDVDDVERVIKPIVIMIDDVSILLTLGSQPNDIYRLFSTIERTLRQRSREIPANKLSHFIVQTMMTNVMQSNNNNNKRGHDSQLERKPVNELNYILSNIENSCDLIFILKPLETGYSTRVDGTITIIDNRQALSVASSKSSSGGGSSSASLLFPGLDNLGEVGTKKAYFFKLGDRRVRLTSSALIF